MVHMRQRNHVRAPNEAVVFTMNLLSCAQHTSRSSGDLAGVQHEPGLWVMGTRTDFAPSGEISRRLSGPRRIVSLAGSRSLRIRPEVRSLY